MAANGAGSSEGPPVGGDKVQRLMASLDSLLDPHIIALAVRDADGAICDFQVEYANEAACRMAQMTGERVQGGRLRTVFPALVGQGLFLGYTKVVQTGEPLLVDDAPAPDQDPGGQRYYDIRAVRLDDGLVLTLRDVTDRHEAAEQLKQATRRLAESEELYRLLAENAWDVVWTMELDSRISYISPSVERVRGLTPAEAMAQPLDEIQPPESAAMGREYYQRLFQAIASGAELPSYHGEQQYYRKDGSIMYGELEVIPQVDAQGRPVRIVGVTRDISERKRFEAELNRLAVTDPLTGVWNRRHGEQLLHADLAGARRYDSALSLLVLDIDNFKAINDTHGHQAGDHVLVELTRRLSANLRASDILARWGGDEFVIVLRNCDIEAAVQLGEKLLALVANAPFDEVGEVTVSIGAAPLAPEDDLASWFRRADRAMYEAKTTRGNAIRAAQQQGRLPLLAAGLAPGATTHECQAERDDPTDQGHDEPVQPQRPLEAPEQE